MGIAQIQLFGVLPPAMGTGVVMGGQAPGIGPAVSPLSSARKTPAAGAQENTQLPLKKMVAEYRMHTYKKKKAIAAQLATTA